MSISPDEYMGYEEGLDDFEYEETNPTDFAPREQIEHLRLRLNELHHTFEDRKDAGVLDIRDKIKEVRIALGLDPEDPLRREPNDVASRHMRSFLHLEVGGVLALFLAGASPEVFARGPTTEDTALGELISSLSEKLAEEDERKEPPTFAKFYTVALAFIVYGAALDSALFACILRAHGRAVMLDIVKLLLASGAQPASPDMRGFSLLHNVMNAHHSVLQLLIDHGLAVQLPEARIGPAAIVWSNAVDWHVQRVDSSLSCAIGQMQKGEKALSVGSISLLLKYGGKPAHSRLVMGIVRLRAQNDCSQIENMLRLERQDDSWERRSCAIRAHAAYWQ
jgi:hypothetical protein